MGRMEIRFYSGLSPHPLCPFRVNLQDEPPLLARLSAGEGEKKKEGLRPS